MRTGPGPSCTPPLSLQDSVLEEDFPDTQRVLKVR